MVMCLMPVVPVVADAQTTYEQQQSTEQNNTSNIQVSYVEKVSDIVAAGYETVYETNFAGAQDYAAEAVALTDSYIEVKAGADEDAGILCFLELLVQAGSVNRGDADCINALVDSLLDQLQLSGHVCGGSADVVNSQTPISGVLLGAIVGGLKERVAGDLRDEGHGHAIHRALAFGKSGGAQRQRHAQYQKHRQNLFHSFGFLL